MIYTYGTLSDTGILISVTQTSEKLPAVNSSGQRVLLLTAPIPESPHAAYVFSVDSWSWVDPRTPDTEWPLVRAERDRRLLASDWTQLPDVPITTKEAWTVYRQALRDITLQPDPFNIVWPTPPQ